MRPGTTVEDGGVRHTTTVQGWWYPSIPVGNSLPVGEWHWPGDGCENANQPVTDSPE